MLRFNSFVHFYKHVNIWLSITFTTSTHALLKPPNIDPPNTPNLPLILRLLKPQTPPAIRLSPLPNLRSKPQRNPLEVVTHAPLRTRGQFRPGASHVPIKHLALLVRNVK